MSVCLLSSKDFAMGLENFLQTCFLERCFCWAGGGRCHLLLLFCLWFLLPYLPGVWLPVLGFFLIKKGRRDKPLLPTARVTWGESS